MNNSTMHKIAASIGIVSSLLGIIAVFLPWCEHDGSFTGLDFVTGAASSIGTGFQAYVPAVVMIVLFVSMIFAIRSFINQNNGFTAYGILLFGFISLGITIVFGTWVPQPDLKMMLNGGIGLYLEVIACSLYIVSGLIDYTYRPVTRVR